MSCVYNYNDQSLLQFKYMIFRIFIFIHISF